MGFFSWLFKKSKPKKIKLGLALGSGGAKGFAELGVLRAFEENGIEFDVVGGASIGSIIGAFYAGGYTSVDMLELFKNVNLGDIKSFFMINIDSFELIKIIEKILGEKNIEELKKPFCAVATVLETGEEYVFKSGSVAKSVSASSSIPPFFKPVVINDMRFVDGAFSNSVPADRVKELGADYVVGVDLSSHENKTSILSMIFPTYKGKVEKPWAKGYENSNVMIHPDLKEYKATSIRYAKEMFDIGYKSAIEVMPKILSDIKKLTKR